MKQRANKWKLYNYPKARPKTNWFSSFYETSTETSFQIMFWFDKAEFNNLVLDLVKHLNSQFSEGANVAIGLTGGFVQQRIRSSCPS